VISASRLPMMSVVQPWMSKSQTLPTPSPRRSTCSTQVLSRVAPLPRFARHLPNQPRQHQQGTAERIPLSTHWLPAAPIRARRAESVSSQLGAQGDGAGHALDQLVGALAAGPGLSGKGITPAAAAQKPAATNCWIKGTSCSSLQGCAITSTQAMARAGPGDSSRTQLG